ncbi:hypothetical protein SLE2022_388050 [Rubroshorea leprosula]
MLIRYDLYFLKLQNSTEFLQLLVPSLLVLGSCSSSILIMQTVMFSSVDLSSTVFSTSVELRLLYVCCLFVSREETGELVVGTVANVFNPEACGLLTCAWIVWFPCLDAFH